MIRRRLCFAALAATLLLGAAQPSAPTCSKYFFGRTIPAAVAVVP